jgi:hypothetical protein
MASLASIAALLVFEIGYISIFYDPNGHYTQAGLMLIFAFEVSFMFKVSTSNLDEKKATGAISKSSRVYTAFLGVALLALLAVGSGALGLERYPLLWIVLFVLSAGAKTAWVLRKRGIVGAEQT